MSNEQYIRGVMSGDAKGPAATMLRVVTRIAEPFYASVTTVRNKLYDGHILKARELPRPVISVGNLTTGGTGKTPVIAWLARQLTQAGHRPAILLRGYKKSATGESDEALAYAEELAGLDVPVAADADRYASGMALLKSPNPPDVFLLDDGLQHRKLARNFDLVLIDATNPFGFGHILPRGMLRESPKALARASAALITHADQVSDGSLRAIEDDIRKYNASVPIFHCSHRIDRLIDTTGATIAPQDKPVYAFAGIGNPQSFLRSLKDAGFNVAGTSWLNDHAEYTPSAMAEIDRLARQTGAHLLVTTRKDMVKLKNAATTSAPMAVATLTLQFPVAEDSKLLDLIQPLIAHRSTPDRNS